MMLLKVITQRDTQSVTILILSLGLNFKNWFVMAAMIC